MFGFTKIDKDAATKKAAIDKDTASKNAAIDKDAAPKKAAVVKTEPTVKTATAKTMPTAKAASVAKAAPIAKTIDKSEKIIELVGITKVFDSTFTAVDDINLSIKKGEFVTLLGPSGCGKTTLLRMIAGFETPTSGQIFLEKKDVTDIPPNKRNVNTVFQRYALFPHLNVFNNIAFGLKLMRIETIVKDKKGKEIIKKKRMPSNMIKEKVSKALNMVGLEGYGHRNVNSLSGGQQQRVAIARALVLEPKVLLLDEPLGALDLKMRKEMQIELKDMHRNLGITFVYVTHDQEEALTMSDRIMVINDGVIQQVGTPKQIYDEPINAFVANFIGESNILSGVMIQDFNVSFCGETFVCEDKGFEKNERVDLVIRPEDIVLDSASGQLEGEVVSVVFKGTYYEMNILSGDYEFTVQSTEGRKVGDKVKLNIAPNAIHIMKKMRTANEFITVMTSEDTVEICGHNFEIINNLNLEKGDTVKATVAFDKIELTDDEDDGMIGGNITQSLYKGSYYQVQVFSDTDEDFYLDTIYEWDIDDRVGINIKPQDIILQKFEEEERVEESQS